MFKKIAVTTMAVAVIATSAMTVTTQTADAKNGRKGAFAAGAVIGLATGAIIGSQYNSGHGPAYGYGYRPAPRPYRCFNKAVRCWDPYYGHYVVVGYREVCRY